MSVALCRLGTGFVAELLRHGLGDTLFHNGSLGLSATSMAGVGKGFNREPGGTLNSMTTGGTSYYYLTDALGSAVAHTDESGTKVSSCGYSPRGVQRGTTSEQVTPPSRFAGGYQDPPRTLSLGGIGNSLGIGTILQKASPGGTGAADTATAAVIADVGITALCAAGAAGNPGARSCQPEEGAGMMRVLAAPPLL